jgi:hypothetical protein
MASTNLIPQPARIHSILHFRHRDVLLQRDYRIEELTVLEGDCTKVVQGLCPQNQLRGSSEGQARHGNAHKKMATVLFHLLSRRTRDCTGYIMIRLLVLG